MKIGVVIMLAENPAVLVALVMILRTALEDRILKAKLPGYPEYAEHVRFRLLPGVW